MLPNRDCQESAEVIAQVERDIRRAGMFAAFAIAGAILFFMLITALTR